MLSAQNKLSPALLMISIAVTSFPICSNEDVENEDDNDGAAATVVVKGLVLLMLAILPLFMVVVAVDDVEEP